MRWSSVIQKIRLDVKTLDSITPAALDCGDCGAVDRGALVRVGRLQNRLGFREDILHFRESRTGRPARSAARAQPGVPYSAYPTPNYLFLWS